MAQNTSATPVRAKPTYIQMCIIHAEQKLTDFRKLQAQCITQSQSWFYLAEVIRTHQQALEALRLAEICVGQELHKIEQAME